MEKNIPKVSVIIAAYNVEKYIAQCLESIINQTLKDIEIICVNDGSSDGTLEILNEYAKKDERVIVINQKQKGPGGARNSALDVARGEYLIIQDSDDWRELDCLEKLYNAAVKNNLDTVVGDAYFVSENGIYFKNFINELPFGKIIDSKKIPKGVAYWCQFLYRKEPIKTKKIKEVL